MEKLVYFFEHAESWQRTLILVIGLLVFWVLEGIIPLVSFNYKKLRHAGLNLFFTLTTILINFGFAYLTIMGSDYTSSRHLGLLYIVRMPVWLFAISGLLILDFVGAWLIHWIEHRVKWMWKFHIVHHTDTWVDTTTANRHHPGESIFRALFTLLGVLISGTPVWLVFLYQSCSVFFAQFNHANISLPKWMDDLMSWIIVSPDMHKVHHHYVQPLTDTNYGNIFSCWDRIFGTFVRAPDASKIRYGIDVCTAENEHNSMAKLLQIPFAPYRPPLGAKFNEVPRES
ncbi:MAG TPA: sterol desaturase family protein [Puia sp.]|nr:sterol desaturase family protein [Puia sp.]